MFYQAYLSHLDDLMLKRYLDLRDEASYQASFLMVMQDFDHTSPVPLLPSLLGNLSAEEGISDLFDTLAGDYLLTLSPGPLSGSSLSKDLTSFLQSLLPPSYPPPTRALLVKHVF